MRGQSAAAVGSATRPRGRGQGPIDLGHLSRQTLGDSGLELEVLRLFAAMAQVPDGAGLGPVAVAQVTATVTIAVTASVLRQRWLPTHRFETWGVLAGLLATLAVVLFLLSTHHGLLTVAAVLTSLYPAFTVLLAATALREHVHRAQAVGLLLSGVAVALVAAG